MARPVSQGGIDYPDGGFASGGGIYPVTLDVGELAARLGCPSTHNREGNVVFIESFEHGLQGWSATGYGTGGEIIISAEKYRSSGYSAKLIAGSDGDKKAVIFRKFPYPTLGLYGLELSFLIEAHTDYVRWRLTHHDGTSEYQFTCEYDVDNRDLNIMDENGDYVTIDSDLYLNYGSAPFHTVKIVADLTTNEYVRAIVNDNEYDLSAYPGYPWAADDGAHVRTNIWIEGEAGHNGFSYVDDVILTQNEPTR